MRIHSRVKVLVTESGEDQPSEKSGAGKRLSPASFN
jgi:hypothetical protein